MFTLVLIHANLDTNLVNSVCADQTFILCVRSKTFVRPHRSSELAKNYNPSEGGGSKVDTWPGINRISHRTRKLEAPVDDNLDPFLPLV